MTENELGNSDARISEFKLERLKFILNQIQRLNEQFHKYVVLYQTVATAIVGATATVFIAWKKLDIDVESAQVAIQGLMWLLLLHATFVVLSVITGIRAWKDFRDEEVELFNECVVSGYRKSASWQNIARWNETWLVVFVILSAIGIAAFISYEVMPHVR